MEEPMAFSSLRGSDRCPADDSLKKYEQSVKLSGIKREATASWEFIMRPRKQRALISRLEKHPC